MPLPPDTERVYWLIDAEDYTSAGTLIQQLRSAGREDCELILYEAICAYENSDDLGCLRFLRDFLQQAPQHQKQPYAAFTASVCLINLGLHEAALQLLLRLPSSYPDRDTEIASVRTTLKRTRAARKDAKAIFQLLSAA